jgi:hypothetical protein
MIGLRLPCFTTVAPLQTRHGITVKSGFGIDQDLRLDLSAAP